MVGGGKVAEEKDSQDEDAGGAASTDSEAEADRETEEGSLEAAEGPGEETKKDAG
jgi:hypothetical protein